MNTFPNKPQQPKSKLPIVPGVPKIQSPKSPQPLKPATPAASKPATTNPANKADSAGNPPRPGLTLLPSKSNPKVRRWQDPNEEQPAEPRMKKPDVPAAPKTPGQQKPQGKERPDFQEGDRVAFQTPEQAQAGQGKFSYGKVVKTSDNFVAIQGDDGKLFPLPKTRVNHPHDTERPAKPTELPLPGETEQKPPAAKKQEPAKRTTGPQRSKDVTIESETGERRRGILLESGDLWQKIQVGAYVDYIKLGKVRENAIVEIRFGNHVGVHNVDGTNDIIHRSDIIHVHEGESVQHKQAYDQKLTNHLKRIEKQLNKLHLQNRDMKHRIGKVAARKGVSAGEQEKVNKQLTKEKAEKDRLQAELKTMEEKLIFAERSRLEWKSKYETDMSERKKAAQELKELESEINLLTKTNIDQTIIQRRKDREASGSKQKLERNIANWDMSRMDFDSVDDQLAIDVMTANLTGGLLTHRQKELRDLFHTDKPGFFQRMLNYAKQATKDEAIADPIQLMNYVYGDQWIHGNVLENAFKGHVEHDDAVNSIYEQFGIDESEMVDHVINHNVIAINKALNEGQYDNEKLTGLKEGSKDYDELVEKLTHSIIAKGMTDNEILEKLYGSGKQPDKQQPVKTEGVQIETPDIEYSEDDFVPSHHADDPFIPSDEDFHALRQSTEDFENIYRNFTAEEKDFYDEYLDAQARGDVYVDHFLTQSELETEEIPELSHFIEAMDAQDAYGMMHDDVADKMIHTQSTAQIIADHLILKAQEEGKIQKQVTKLQSKLQEGKEDFVQKFKKSMRFIMFGRIIKGITVSTSVRPGLVLMPSRKNPKVRRWINMDNSKKPEMKKKQIMDQNEYEEFIKDRISEYEERLENDDVFIRATDNPNLLSETRSRDMFPKKTMLELSQKNKMTTDEFEEYIEDTFYIPNVPYEFKHDKDKIYVVYDGYVHADNSYSEQVDLLGNYIVIFEGEDSVRNAYEDGLLVKPTKILEVIPKYHKYVEQNKSLQIINNLFKSRKLHNRYTFQGIPVSIENRKGSVRSGTDDDGHDWSIKMNYDYGYIRLTEGVDGDHLDIYVGPNKKAENVYIIHQNNPDTGEYDEDKCMVGFDSPEDAEKAFKKQYDRPEFYSGNMTTLTMDAFKKHIQDKKNVRKPVTFDPKDI